MLDALVGLWVVFCLVVCVGWVLSIPYQLSASYLEDLKEARKR